MGLSLRTTINPKLGSVLFVTSLLLLQLVQDSEAVISCNEVTKDLMPCASYLANGSGKPPSACCAGAKALSSAATSSDDKKAACKCIKSAAGNAKYNAKLAQDLPGNCGINMPFPVSASIDCSTVS